MDPQDPADPTQPMLPAPPASSAFAKAPPSSDHFSYTHSSRFFLADYYAGSAPLQETEQALADLTSLKHLPPVMTECRGHDVADLGLSRAGRFSNQPMRAQKQRRILDLFRAIEVWNNEAGKVYALPSDALVMSLNPFTTPFMSLTGEDRTKWIQEGAVGYISRDDIMFHISFSIPEAERSPFPEDKDKDRGANQEEDWQLGKGLVNNPVVLALQTQGHSVRVLYAQSPVYSFNLNLGTYTSTTLSLSNKGYLISPMLGRHRTAFQTNGQYDPQAISHAKMLPFKHTNQPDITVETVTYDRANLRKVAIRATLLSTFAYVRDIKTELSNFIKIGHLRFIAHVLQTKTSSVVFVLAVPAKDRDDRGVEFDFGAPLIDADLIRTASVTFPILSVGKLSHPPNSKHHYQFKVVSIESSDFLHPAEREHLHNNFLNRVCPPNIHEDMGFDGMLPEDHVGDPTFPFHTPEVTEEIGKMKDLLNHSPATGDMPWSILKLWFFLQKTVELTPVKFPPGWSKDELGDLDVLKAFMSSPATAQAAIDQINDGPVGMMTVTGVAPFYRSFRVLSAYDDMNVRTLDFSAILSFGPRPLAFCFFACPEAIIQGRSMLQLAPISHPQWAYGPFSPNRLLGTDEDKSTITVAVDLFLPGPELDDGSRETSFKEQEGKMKAWAGTGAALDFTGKNPVISDDCVQWIPNDILRNLVSRVYPKSFDARAFLVALDGSILRSGDPTFVTEEAVRENQQNSSTPSANRVAADLHHFHICRTGLPDPLGKSASNNKFEKDLPLPWGGEPDSAQLLATAGDWDFGNHRPTAGVITNLEDITSKQRTFRPSPLTPTRAFFLGLDLLTSAGYQFIHLGRRSDFASFGTFLGVHLIPNSVFPEQDPLHTVVANTTTQLMDAGIIPVLAGFVDLSSLLAVVRIRCRWALNCSSTEEAQMIKRFHQYALNWDISPPQDSVKSVWKPPTSPPIPTIFNGCNTGSVHFSVSTNSRQHFQGTLYNGLHRNGIQSGDAEIAPICDFPFISLVPSTLGPQSIKGTKVLSSLNWTDLRIPLAACDSISHVTIPGTRRLVSCSLVVTGRVLSAVSHHEKLMPQSSSKDPVANWMNNSGVLRDSTTAEWNNPSAGIPATDLAD